MVSLIIESNRSAHRVSNLIIKFHLLLLFFDPANSKLFLFKRIKKKRKITFILIRFGNKIKIEIKVE